MLQRLEESVSLGLLNNDYAQEEEKDLAMDWEKL